MFITIHSHIYGLKLIASSVLNIVSHELVLDHLSGCATNFSIAMSMKTPQSYELVCYGESTVTVGRLLPLSFSPEFQPHALYGVSLKVRKYSLLITPAILSIGTVCFMF